MILRWWWCCSLCSSSFFIISHRHIFNYHFNHITISATTASLIWEHPSPCLNCTPSTSTNTIFPLLNLLARKMIRVYVLSLLLFGVRAFPWNPKVQTIYGEVEGEFKDGVAVFKNVPFAQPPVGDFRFKSPQPLEKWKGTLDCKTTPKLCPPNT